MKTLVALAAIAGSVAVAAIVTGTRPPAPVPGPQTVRIAPARIEVRPIGSFQRDGRTVTPPLQVRAVGGFEIMRYQVSGADYAACVADGACRASRPVDGDMPQTHVSWRDATDYAGWLTVRTGRTWRLPSAAEWQLAAAERFGDASVETDGSDPARRWVAQYERGAGLRSAEAQDLLPRGGYGLNSLGVADLAGNVWEWTDECLMRGEVDADGIISTRDPYCGVRVAGGQHIAVVIDFVRDASVGGCAVGLPPDYLGFRLVTGG